MLSAAARLFALRGLVVAFALVSASTLLLLRHQVAGIDYSCFWAGGKAVLEAPAHLYDFDYITAQQGWPLGPGVLRPYINPPSALLIFAPLAMAPYWLSFGLWTVGTAALFWWAGRKAGAPAWMMLIPIIAFAAYCGQVTLLIGALGLAGLALQERRLLAGVLFGIAACIKPQCLILLPVALLAERAWRTILATAATGLVLCAASAALWGLQVWIDWLQALGRFSRLIFETPGLHLITPYGQLLAWGAEPAWAFLLIPFVIAGVWLVFRRDASLADRSLVLFGGALLISPYAMNYELALLAPALALYLSRTKNRAWPVYALIALIQILTPSIIALIAVFVLPAARLFAARLRPQSEVLH